MSSVVWLNNLVLAAKKYILPLALSTLGVFAPAYQLLFVVGVLVTVDTITGSIAAVKKGEKFSSEAFSRIITKNIKYFVAILAGYLVEKYLINGAFSISKITATYAGITELISILENMDAMSDKPMFANLIAKLLSKRDS